MIRSGRQLNLVAILGCIPVSLSIQMADTPLTWLLYVAVFFTFIEATPRAAFLRGVMIGSVTAVINFSWLFSSAGRFTGTGLLFGLIAVGGLALFFALYCGSIAWLYARLKCRGTSLRVGLVNATLIASLWVFLDGFMIYVAKSFALALFVTYVAVGDNIFALQPATVLGPLVITFVIVFVNAALAHILYYRLWRFVFLPPLFIAVYLGWGWLLLTRFEQRQPTGSPPPFRAAIIAENINPEFKWAYGNTNSFAERMFLLNVQVAKAKANLAVWSESAIPWNYAPGDDFLNEIDKITGSSGVTHLTGINTDYRGNTFYNSVYCIKPGNTVAGRYDKRLALSLIEKPFCGMLLPFFNSTGFRVKEGITDQPLITGYGKAGIVLCNESSVPEPAYASVRAGATFLVNPGNDGWFTDSYIPKQHFFHARLRAIETRRDIIMNSNLGYSGLVQASGRVVFREKTDQPYVETLLVGNHEGLTPAVAYPYLMLVIAALAFTAVLVYRYRTPNA